MVLYKLICTLRPCAYYLEFIYLKASTVEKQLLLKEVFSEDIVLTKEGVRTAFALEMFKDKALHINEILIACNAKKRTKKDESPISTHDWIRTSTSVRTLPPQSSVSTNSTTWVNGSGGKINDFRFI
jgi:hypothetical protein